MELLLVPAITDPAILVLEVLELVILSETYWEDGVDSVDGGLLAARFLGGQVRQETVLVYFTLLN
jgi:hypothetical protein